MRKLIFKTLFLIIFLFLIGIKSNTIVAIDSFPSEIKVTVTDNDKNHGNSSRINFGAGNIYKKVYTSSMTKGQGKALCTAIWNYAPGAGELTQKYCGKIRTCQKAYWTNPKEDQETQIAIGIGTIINKARQLSGSTTGGINGWDYYYAAEFAINRFLYEKLNKSVNSVKDISSTNSKFAKMITAAREAYNNKYNADKILIAEPTLNKEKGTVTTKITCQDKINNVMVKTKCSNLSITVKAGNINVSAKKISKTINNDNTVSLTIDVSEYMKNGTNLTIEAANKKTYYTAQNYVCGYCGGVGETLQNITPNLIKPISTKRTASTTVKIEKNIPPDCSSDLNSKIITVGSSITYNYAELSGLYNKYKNGNLLNVEQPSCSNPTSEVTASCSETKLVSKFVTKVNGVDAYCTLDYTLDSNGFYDGKTTTAGILYKSDNRVAATANVIYKCVAPGTDDINKAPVSESISKIIPKFSIVVDGKTTEFSSKLQADSQHKVENGKLVFKRTAISGGYIRWVFKGKIIYSYQEGLSIGKGNLESIDLGTCDSSNKCINLNYGIPSPNKTGTGEATLKLNLTDTLYKKISSNNINSTCPYEIIEKDIITGFNYRTIDTEEPFLTKNGEERYTGNNWCDSSINNENILDDSIEEVIDEKQDTICHNKNNEIVPYRGDMNKNGVWDENDKELLKQCIKDNNCSVFGNLADVDYSGVVDNDDMELLENFIKSDFAIGDVNFDGQLDAIPIKLQSGDIRGDDSNLIQDLQALNIPYESELQRKLADVNLDCKVDIKDTTSLQESLEKDEQTESPESPESLDSPKYQMSVYSNAHICSAKNKTVENYITYRPNSDGNFTTKTNGKITTRKAEPLYSFTLTPDNIKKIREYNKKTTYDDFSLDCKDSKECVSSLVTTMFTDSSFAKESSGLCKAASEKKEFCNVLSVLGLEDK